jgi:hypothetical protein
VTTGYAAGRNYPMSAAVLLRTGPQPAAAGCGAVTGGLDRDRHMAQATIVSGQGKEEHPDRRHGQQVEPSQKPGERPREWYRARARGPPQRVPNDQRQQKRGAEDDGGAQPVDGGDQQRCRRDAAQPSHNGPRGLPPRFDPCTRCRPVSVPSADSLWRRRTPTPLRPTSTASESVVVAG